MKKTTSITGAEYETAKKHTLRYLSSHTSITNRILRTLTPIEYDQAIVAFGRMCRDGVIERRGNAGGTHYVLVSGGAEENARIARRSKEGEK